jgi:ATP-dependent Lhr-like helicase
VRGHLNQILQQLRGFAVPGAIWERDVLPARIPDFDPSTLAERCEAGELQWAAEGGRNARRARVRFFFRGEGGLFLDRAPADDALAALSAGARNVLEFLKEEGAALLPDVAEGAGLERAAARAALVELVLAGLATNDSLAALHAVLGYEPSTAVGGRPAGLRSSLEAQLAARRSPDSPRLLTRHRWHEARRRARDTAFTRTFGSTAALESGRPGAGWIGRWSLVHRTSLLGRALPADELATRQARLLLARWGVVTRACLEREAPLLRWEAVYPALARLELRGEVRRGYFVEGLPGIQFALPEAVELLRAVNAERHGTSTEPPEPVVLGAADPAQLFGTESWGGTLRFARVASSAVASWGGEPVAAFEDGGAGVSVVPDHPALVPALRALGHWWAARTPITIGPMPGRSRLKVERWHDQPVLGSNGVPLLEAAGFVREGSAMLWVGAARARLPA